MRKTSPNRRVLMMTHIERHEWTERSPRPPRVLRPGLKAKLARLAAAEGRNLSSYLELVLDEHMKRTSRT